MKQKPVPNPLSVFVCDGKKCQGGKKLCGLLKKAVKHRKLKHSVTVCTTACMDQCEKGPNIMIFPDNVWLSKVHERDIEAIVDHLSAHIYAEES